MALAKERTAPESTSHVSVFHQACSYYGNMYGGHPDSSVGLFGLENYTKMVTDEEDNGAEKNGSSIKNYVLNRLPSLNDENMNPSSTAMFDQNMNSSPEEEGGHHDESVLHFKAGHSSGNWMQSSNGSLLSFDHGEGVMDYNYHRLSEDVNCFDTSTTGYAKQGSQLGDQERFGWLYSGARNAASIPESRLFADHTNHHNKRPHMDDDEEQANKKHCSNAAKKPKPKTAVPSKDPQSIAAKNRRERISERLKILQDLVPNGTKVDLVTMLEKAISYVKFLQLQVKVLATDEFWPVQGGKAPEVAQVKEAIDAILSSHHNSDRNSSSK